MIEAIAEFTGLHQEDVADALQEADGRTHVRTVFADAWDDDDDDDDDDEWELEELGSQTSAAARDDLGMIEAIAEFTELHQEDVAEALQEADGRTHVRTVFADAWDDDDDDDNDDDEWELEELGSQTSAAARDDLGMIEAIAEFTGLHQEDVADALQEADGRTHVRTVFAGVWDDDDDDDDDDEWELEELGSQTSAAARDDLGMIEAIAEFTELHQEDVADALQEADGRTHVRTVFADAWDDDDDDDNDDDEWELEELGSQTSAAARDDLGMIEAIAEFTELHQEDVAEALQEADGRTHVRTVFADAWPG